MDKTSAAQVLCSEMLERLGWGEVCSQLPLSAAAHGCVLWPDVSVGAGSFVLSMLACANRQGLVWVVCANQRRQMQIALELDLWQQAYCLVPELPEYLGDDSEDAQLQAERLQALAELQTARPGTLVLCTQAAMAQRVPACDAQNPARLELQLDMQLDLEALQQQLQQYGFKRSAQVVHRGEWAWRGGIVDIFALNLSAPLRIELFDDQIESLRLFDIHSQLSRQRLQQCEILLQVSEQQKLLADLPSAADVVLALDCDYAAPLVLGQRAAELALERPEAVALQPGVFFASPLGSFDAGDFVLQNQRRSQVLLQLQEWVKLHWRVVMVFANEAESKRFFELLEESGCSNLQSAISVLYGELASGFSLPQAGLVVLSASELFGRYVQQMPKRMGLEAFRQRELVEDWQELEEGELVVHAVYGIGRYHGLQLGAQKQEELVIEFADESFLMVPLNMAHLLARYPPQLNKLGDNKWQRARKAAEKSINDYASQLIGIHAQRELQPGHSFAPDSRWMWELENSFHYSETPDQLRAIAQTKADMESARAMDRLICGDVGFGKTEVAIRAAFKAITGGKQVLMMAPTTVLAEQHWHTLRQRYSDYPVRVELLNRFRSASEVRSTLQGLADGSVDMVVGTHRLASEDVNFKDLGLVIIDEEQRFGVKHKEVFKQRFQTVDVLTLSATPIPRTLYMALMGARDMSTIETPPPNRLAVHTRVLGYDEDFIKKAISFELQRGGQVFYLHNRVQSIDGVAAKLRDLLPQARIVVGHGQMDKSRLESVMHDFVSGKADVLLATTIIESGIDIPNANTIIIDRADLFGLADLYQLRGRVGRSGVQAYAYLLINQHGMEAGDAYKRLMAIRQYAALGSGFKIAMRDLEIRGAGNLLGKQQSGHIAAIGFELYCQLLKQAVERLQKGDLQVRSEAVLRIEGLVYSQAQWTAELANPQRDARRCAAFLSTEYIDDAALRLQAYRSLNACSGIEQLRQLESAWQDRFGNLPKEARHLLLLQHIRILANSHNISCVEIKDKRLMLTRNHDYILLGDKSFPRLQSALVHIKLQETVELLTIL